MPTYGPSFSRVTPAENPTREYVRGGFRVTLSSPRLAHETASAAEYAWFAGMHRFPSGEILLRMNAHPDSGLGDGTTRHILSVDGGQTFDPDTIYDVTGSHTSNEPLYMEADGTLRGGDYARFSWTDEEAGLRSVQCAYWEFTNGGRDYDETPLGCTIAGFPRDIGTIEGAPWVFWFGEIVRVSDAQWLSVLPVKFATSGVNDGYYTSTIIQSADRGVTWTYVGSVNAGNGFGAEGMSEPSLQRLQDGRLMVASRVGVGRLASAFSSDLGLTWSTPARISPWFAGPRLKATSSGVYVITTGRAPAENVAIPPPSPAAAQVPSGIFLSLDPEATEWTAIDLIAHHNAMMAAPHVYNANGDGCTGYMSILELAPGHLLINYDDARGAYGDGSQKNRVFVVDAWIEVL